MRTAPTAIIAIALLPLVLSADGGGDVSGSIEIDVRCEPDAHRIEGTAVLTLRDLGAGEPVFELHPGLTVEGVEIDGSSVPFETTPGAGDGSSATIAIRTAKPLPGVHRVSVTYRGTIHEPPRVAQFSREFIADQTKGTIQSEGVFLAPAGAWYPRLQGGERGSFRLGVRLPAGWEAAAEGRRVRREEEAGGTWTVFEGTLPDDGVHLVAGRYKRLESDHHGVTVAAYVYPEDADLAEPYAAAVKRYLDMYSAWFGPYAYDRFAVVENFFPTGYGMPGFTLLGREVMRLPFIIGTSLGHEVAHSWWGNAVYVDEKGGNWCEGLTTYVADYHYKELEGPEAAAEYRRETARDYTNYVSEAGRDFPLTEFTERSTPATRAVGYGKAMMVFHMLERRVGRDHFDAALRRVYREYRGRAASWSTWREAFREESGEDLGWFFRQWIDRSGAPSLGLGEVEVLSEAPEHVVRGELTAREGPWRLRVPVVVEGEGQVERRNIDIDGTSARFEVRVRFRPDLLRVDPDQNVFRRLDPQEMPPVLSRVLGDPQALFVIDDTHGAAAAAAYREMATTLARTGEGRLIDAAKASPDLLSGRTVFLLGLPDLSWARDLLRDLPREVRISPGMITVRDAKFDQPGASVLAVGWKPGETERAVAVFHGLTPAAVQSAGRKLVHYGKYSYLVFVDGTNKAKGVAAATGGPLVRRVAAP
jgi:hypothetical protein